MSMSDTVSKLLSDTGAEHRANAIVQMIGGHEGGSAGMIQRFQNLGLGNMIASWLGSGDNMPITATQVQKVFGTTKISALAGKFGISPEAASSKIAELLPTVVDKLSPDGALPEGGDLLERAATWLKAVAPKSA
jgi:uncharacterized protein YidB (DUF937 family)